MNTNPMIESDTEATLRKCAAALGALEAIHTDELPDIGHDGITALIQPIRAALAHEANRVTTRPPTPAD